MAVRRHACYVWFVLFLMRVCVLPAAAAGGDVESLGVVLTSCSGDEETWEVADVALSFGEDSLWDALSTVEVAPGVRECVIQRITASRAAGTAVLTPGSTGSAKRAGVLAEVRGSMSGGLERLGLRVVASEHFGVSLMLSCRGPARCCAHQGYRPPPPTPRR